MTALQGELQAISQMYILVHLFLALKHSWYVPLDETNEDLGFAKDKLALLVVCYHIGCTDKNKQFSKWGQNVDF